MNTHSASIDISNNPELVRLAEKVKKTKEPLSLKNDEETVAMIVPVDTTKGTLPKIPKKTKADFEAFMSAAGSWKDIDTDALIEKIYADRRHNNKRPPIKL